MKTNHFTAGCFTEKFPWKSIDSSPTLVASWHLVSPGSLSVASFAWGVVTQGVFFAAISAGKKKPSPRPSKHWKLQQTFDRCCFFQKKCGGWFRHGCFFLKSLISGKEPFLEAFLSARTNGDPIGYKFMKLWSCNELGTTTVALEYIYISYWALDQ